MHKAQKHFPKMDLCSVLLDHSCQENHRSSGRCCFFLIQITKQKRLISGPCCKNVDRMLLGTREGTSPHTPSLLLTKEMTCCTRQVSTALLWFLHRDQCHWTVWEKGKTQKEQKKKKNCEKHRERISLDILSTRHAEHGKGRLGDGEKVGERERETGTWEDDHQSAFFCCAQLGALLVEETESEGKRNTSIKRGRGRQEEGKEEWGKHMLALSRPAERQW